MWNRVVQFRHGRRSVVITVAAVWVWFVATALPVHGQVTPEEHASHHPDQAAAATQPGASPAGKTGGMMEGMGEMMKGMGAPPPKDLYPSLMALPKLSPEQRKQVEQQAGERMHAGTALMAQALDTLNAGTQSGDYAAMHEAMTRLREGAAQLESGIAARRALAEGRAPREVALGWFKREMNLAVPIPRGEPRAFPGVSLFHLFTMGLLIAFALAMVVMYFFKMRRAAALFGRIEASKGAPPPGAAPELAGGKPPSGDKPPAGDSPKAAPQERPVTTKFERRAPAARAVFLVGTFNGWDPKATPMIKDAEGNWDVAVALPPGRYEFKFVVDGVLCCEPGCDEPHHGCQKCVPNSSGTMNRLIEVAAPPAAGTNAAPAAPAAGTPSASGTSPEGSSAVPVPSGDVANAG